ncbi:hypothetical protein [Spongiactinospora sp. TRM90649]|uniref:hypothetical protein n=1 Tax=Spongiactinospora sp. TRM90649 TaxID=3031114 RepID=UPI0023F70A21|nr:hypothetical protein [Spongiactinospora sp. TRM90649]MDF5753048.1 hypothetical protein [Spongiactinospora sp. TRM90649]
MPVGRIDIGGVIYTTRAAPGDSAYTRALALLRATDTPRGRRIVASLVVVEARLGSASLNELLDRIDDEADPLDWSAFLTAASRLADDGAMPGCGRN